MANGPTWPRSGGSTEALKKMSSSYKDALEEIATGLARRAHAERVLVNHVQEADRIIEVAGKTRRSFWWCQEMQTAAGGFLIGVVPSSQEWVTSFLKAGFGASEWISPTASGATVVLGLAGVFLICHSRFRSIGIFSHHADPLARPKPPTNDASPTLIGEASPLPIPVQESSE